MPKLIYITKLKHFKVYFNLSQFVNKILKVQILMDLHIMYMNCLKKI